jgi:hypothetical protein
MSKNIINEQLIKFPFKFISYLAFSFTLDIGVLLRGGEGGRGARGSPQSSLSLRPPSDAVRYSSSDEKSSDRGVRGVLGTLEGSCSNLQELNYNNNTAYVTLVLGISKY